jgi:hypothetical protein
MQLNSGNNILYSQNVFWNVIACGLLNIAVLVECATTVVMIDVGSSALGMEAADSSETLVSVTQLHGSISQMTVM